MLGAQRLEEIMSYLREHGVAKVEDLAQTLEVTPMTIRRDLKRLEEEGLVFRIHGGATLKNPLYQEKLYDEKKGENLEGKKKIAQRASELVKDSMVILLDAGTTTYELACALKEKDFSKLTVITNDLNIAILLYRVKGIKTIFLGGEIQRETGASIGSTTVDVVKNLYADISFIGASSISEEFYLLTPSEGKIDLKRAMLKIGAKTVLLSDYSKFNRRSLYKICHLENLDYVITDYKLNDSIVSDFEGKGTRIISL